MITSDQASDFLSAGCNVAEIATYSGVPERHVGYLLASHGLHALVEANMRPTTATHPGLDFMRWAAGQPSLHWKTVAKKMGCSRAGAYRYLRAFRERLAGSGDKLRSE